MVVLLDVEVVVKVDVIIKVVMVRWRRCMMCLFVVECVDWIELGGFYCGIKV